MRVRWIIALAAISYVVIIGGALLVGQYVFEILGTQIAGQIEQDRHNYIVPNTANVTISNVTVFNQDNPIYLSADKPRIVTSGLTAEDYRSNVSYSLQISGRVNNTGGGTAYNAYLHVVAMNSEGKAIDSNYSFGGITAHMTLGLNFKLTYNGSAIKNCTITPVYTDALAQVPPFNNSAPKV